MQAVFEGSITGGAPISGIRPFSFRISTFEILTIFVGNRKFCKLNFMVFC